MSEAEAEGIPPEESVAIRPPPRDRYGLHLLLFVATCVTTTWAGLAYVGPEAPDFLIGGDGLESGGLDFEHWWRGVAFSGVLMGILLVHEFGHYIAARIHGVNASLPYFIPLPIPGGLGTLGAVISLREKIRSRNALIDIGAAGPIAGLVVAIPALVVGLLLSEVEPVPLGGGYVSEGNSILYLSLKLAVKGAILPSGGYDVFLHPVAWAAWVGLLVTMINLLPIGQLDGGHIAFAYFGSRYETASKRFHQSLPFFGLAVMAYVFFDSWHSTAAVPEGVPALWLHTAGDALERAIGAAAPWFIWGLLLWALRGASGGKYHPAVTAEPLTPGRRRLGILMFVIFIAILTPVPLRVG